MRRRWYTLYWIALSISRPVRAAVHLAFGRFPYGGRSYSSAYKFLRFLDEIQCNPALKRTLTMALSRIDLPSGE